MTVNGPEILFDKFRIIDCLKKDDHSAVYLADHIYLSKKIILKVLNTNNLPEESILQRFKREAKILAQIDNHYIIRVLDFGTSKEFFYISFEYFLSRNMRYWIRENSLADEKKKSLIIQMFKGIAYAHANNVIHRDIKPENLFISDNLDLKLGDFGLARIINDNYTTSNFSIMGTPCYMSPEQVMGDSLTPATDLFSAGIVIYELFTGVNPFLGKDVNDTINKIINYEGIDSLAKLETLPEDIRKVVNVLLKKNKEDRTVSAVDVLGILGETFSPDEKIAEGNGRSGAGKTQSLSSNTFKKVKNYIITVLITILILLTLFFIFKKEVYERVFTGGQERRVIDTIYIYYPSLHLKQMEKNLDTTKKNDNQVNETIIPEKENLQDKKTEQVPVPKKTGKLFIVCHPWADIYIDSAQVETTPLKGDIVLSEGEHSIKLMHPNYPVYLAKINIKPENRTEIKVNLDTLFGFLDCKVSPWGDVYVSGRLVGQTPFQAPVRLIPGDYTILLKNSSFNPMEFKVKIQKNQTYVLKYNFKN